MKKLLFLFATLLALAGCAANRSKTAVQVAGTGAAAREDGMSIVDGVWQRGTAREIKLYEVKYGRRWEIASATPDAEGRFGFAFHPAAPAFYVIGMDGLTPANNYTFWFKPGDRLNLTVTRNSYALRGGNTPENVEITRWHDWVQQLEIMAFYPNIRNSTFEDFFPLMEDLLAEGYTPEYISGGEFDDAFNYYRDSYMATIASTLILSPRSKHPQREDLPDYYMELELSDLATSRMLDYPYGMSFLKSCPAFSMLVNRDGLNSEERRKTNASRNAIDFIASQLRDDELAGEYVLYNADAIKTYEGYLDFDAKYSHYFVNDGQRERFKKLLADIPVPKGYPAVDFRFPDVDGKEIALSDFKGKVVYIDVWATWCGPCKQQIPFLKKLEAEYHDNPDMVFMSVSIDAEKDHGKWLDMVAAEGLGGVQLFAGSRSDADLQKPYKISGIPHFILVGKDGNIINDDAPRPSSDEIRPMLNAALAR